MHHIISCCIHYECKHEKQVFPCTTWTLKSLYNAGHKLKHFWSQIVPGHNLKHFVVTNRAAVTNWSESQIVPSQEAVRFICAEQETQHPLMVSTLELLTLALKLAMFEWNTSNGGTSGLFITSSYFPKSLSSHRPHRKRSQGMAHIRVTSVVWGLGI